MSETWKYLDSRRATMQHAFLPENEQVSLCGRKPESYGITWKTNEKKLKDKVKCKICLKVLTDLC